MSAPDLTKKVVGFRHWADAEGLLSSTGVAGVWGRGVNEARCSRPTAWYGGAGASGVEQHDAPGPSCQCGLYALHELPDGESGPGPWSAVQVLGAVAAWGQIEVHHTGFRAQYAEVVALAYNEAWPKKLLRSVADLAESYDVPVVEVSKLAARAAEVGESIPVSLRPEKPDPPTAIEPSLLVASGSFRYGTSGVAYTSPSVAWTSEHAPKPEASVTSKRRRWWQR